MTKRAPRSPSKDNQKPKDKPSLEQQARQDSWDKEADKTLNESALRGTPDWMEAIGDPDEDRRRVEADFEDYGWEMQGEDDFVSDPTSEADMPTWLEDDYDDEFRERREERKDRLGDAEDLHEEGEDDELYSNDT